MTNEGETPIVYSDQLTPSIFILAFVIFGMPMFQTEQLLTIMAVEMVHRVQSALTLLTKVFIFFLSHFFLGFASEALAVLHAGVIFLFPVVGVAKLYEQWGTCVIRVLLVCGICCKCKGYSLWCGTRSNVCLYLHRAFFYELIIINKN